MLWMSNQCPAYDAKYQQVLTNDTYIRLMQENQVNFFGHSFLNNQNKMNFLGFAQLFAPTKYYKHYKLGYFYNVFGDCRFRSRLSVSRLWLLLGCSRVRCCHCVIVRPGHNYQVRKASTRRPTPCRGIHWRQRFIAVRSCNWHPFTWRLVFS